MVLYDILDRANNTLVLPLPAPLETRQFVGGLTSMAVASNEDDVVTSICSVALLLRDSQEDKSLVLRKKQSSIVNNRNKLAKCH